MTGSLADFFITEVTVNKFCTGIMLKWRDRESQTPNPKLHARWITQQPWATVPFPLCHKMLFQQDTTKSLTSAETTLLYHHLIVSPHSQNLQLPLHSHQEHFGAESGTAVPLPGPGDTRRRIRQASFCSSVKWKPKWSLLWKAGDRVSAQELPRTANKDEAGDTQFLNFTCSASFETTEPGQQVGQT